MAKTITIQLDSMSFVVDGTSNEELLENAKREMMKQLSIKFPHFSYEISDADVLSLENAHPGVIVKDSKGKLGIITSVNPKNKRPINVTFKGSISVAGTPQCFKLDNSTFDKARSVRPDYQTDDWYEGDSGYLKNKTDLIEVVVGKKVRGKYLVFMINNAGKGFQLTDQQLKGLLKDNKNDFK